MGLLDILNGMQNGPRGPSQPSTGTEENSGGMSPLTMAILALLAWKTVKHFTQSDGQPDATPTPAPSQVPAPGGGSLGGALSGNGSGGGALGGGLGNILAGGLGGLLAGGAAGNVLSGGLGDLLKQLQDNGHGEVANSWVGKGQNKSIAPGDLANALGSDQLDHLTAQSGLSREDLLAGLSKYLPQVIDQLTPDGRLPTEHELSRRV